MDVANKTISTQTGIFIPSFGRFVRGGVEVLCVYFRISPYLVWFHLSVSSSRQGQRIDASCIAGAENALASASCGC